MASVGKNIKRLRVARGMTQEQLAEALFVTRQAVSAWETGKALPNVDALEQIAAALDADVTEVIYGVPRPPDLRRVRRRWAAAGAGLTAVFAALVFLLYRFDFISTWAGGLSYQFHDIDYDLSYTEVPGGYSVEIDLSDPDGNVGKVLYEDESGCRIVVDALDLDSGDMGAWRVFFRAEGVCGQRGGALVTGTLERLVDKRFALFGDEDAAALTTIVDGVSWPGAFAGESGLRKNEKGFGYYFFGTVCGEPEEVENPIVTVTLTGLTRFTTVRSR